MPPTWSRDTEHLKAALCRLQLLAALGVDHGLLLDVGAASGAFVAAASGLGFQASGIEPDDRVGEQARRMGRSVYPGTWKRTGGRYDVITLFDVLEHLTDPLDCLSSLRRHLHPGGMMVVEMPEFLCPLGGWERHIRPEQHVCLYSETAARALFTRAGLAVEALVRPLRGSIGKASYFLREAV